MTTAVTTSTELPKVPITIALGELPSGVRRKPNTYWKPSNPVLRSNERRDPDDLTLTTDNPSVEIEDFTQLEDYAKAQIRAGVRSRALKLLAGELPNARPKEDTPSDDSGRKLVPDTEDNILQILKANNVKKLHLLFRRMMTESQGDRLRLFLVAEEEGQARRTVLSFLRKAVKILGDHTPTDILDPVKEKGDGEKTTG